jgi:hypothetical protein
MIFERFMWESGKKEEQSIRPLMQESQGEGFNYCPIHPPPTGKAACAIESRVLIPFGIMDLTIIKSRFMHRCGVLCPCNSIVSQADSALAICGHPPQVAGISSSWTVNRWCLCFSSFSMRLPGPTTGAC